MEDLNFEYLEQAQVLGELEYKISNEDFYNLLELVPRTTLDCIQQEYMILRINNCETLDEFEAIRRNLLLNRIESKDRISLGLNYSMTDINNAIRQMSKEPRKVTLTKTDEETITEFDQWIKSNPKGGIFTYRDVKLFVGLKQKL